MDLHFPYLTLLSVIACSIFGPLLDPYFSSIAIPIACVCWSAIKRGPLQGVCDGLSAGLLLDLLLDTAIGINLGSLAVLGYVFARVGHKISFWPLFIRVPSVAMMAMLYIPLTIILSRLAGIPFSWTFTIGLKFTVAGILCSCLVAMLFTTRKERRTSLISWA